FRMGEISPSDLPYDLYDELYLPKTECWRHHHVQMKPDEKKRVIELLKKAGIEVKLGVFTPDEDEILLRNWESLKEDLDYEEGEDARGFVGFGGKGSAAASVANFKLRASSCNFNSRLCAGLQRRLWDSVKLRFLNLFDPRRRQLQKGAKPFGIELRQTKEIIVENGKLRRMSEKQLKKVWKAMQNTDGGTMQVMEYLKDFLGPEWTKKCVEKRVWRLSVLEEGGLPKEKWDKLYRAILIEFIRNDKIDELGFLNMLQDTNFDWKKKLGWYTLSYVHYHGRKDLYKSWLTILSLLRASIDKLRENSRPFIVRYLISNAINENRFDEWKNETEKEKGKKMSEKKAMKKYEEVLIELETKQIEQQLKDNRHEYARVHPIYRFCDGKVVDGCGVNRKSTWGREILQKNKKGKQYKSKEIIDDDSDDTDDDMEDDREQKETRETKMERRGEMEEEEEEEGDKETADKVTANGESEEKNSSIWDMDEDEVHSKKKRNKKINEGGQPDGIVKEVNEEDTGTEESSKERKMKKNKRKKKEMEIEVEENEHNEESSKKRKRNDEEIEREEGEEENEASNSQKKKKKSVRFEEERMNEDEEESIEMEKKKIKEKKKKEKKNEIVEE
ncbi:hypothetical protein PFISCL1PPCAC_1594, partial [Pristionchus fissidentatus]